jgi:hypothetical protein
MAGDAEREPRLAVGRPAPETERDAATAEVAVPGQVLQEWVAHEGDQVARTAGGAQPGADKQQGGKGVEKEVRVAEVGADVDLHQQPQVVQAGRGLHQPVEVGQQDLH